MIRIASVSFVLMLLAPIPAEAKERWLEKSGFGLMFHYEAFRNHRLLTAEQGGTPDGFRVDVDGNLWVGWGMRQEGLDGVSVFNPEGKLIGRTDLPERCGNVCFGGRHRNRLFMCGSTSVYSLFVNTQGAAGG
jgi:gluconolactonase